MPVATARTPARRPTWQPAGRGALLVALLIAGGGSAAMLALWHVHVAIEPTGSAIEPARSVVDPARSTANTAVPAMPANNAPVVQSDPPRAMVRVPQPAPMIVPAKRRAVYPPSAEVAPGYPPGSYLARDRSPGERYDDRSTPGR